MVEVPVSFARVFVHIPERAAADWVDRHGAVVSHRLPFCSSPDPLKSGISVAAVWPGRLQYDALMPGCDEELETL